MERIHAQGGLAVAAHPLGVFLSLGSGSLRRLQADPRPERHLDAVELINPSLGGRLRHRALADLNARELQLPGLGNSDAHVLETVASAWTWFPGRTAAEFRAALAAGDVEPAGAHWSTGPQRGGLRPPTGGQGPEAAAYSPPVRRVAIDRD